MLLLSITTTLFLDQQDLKILGRAYFIYLLVYSGLEFTLTFLTHHTFGFTSMQQGWMFLGIGLIMAVLQGGWVRHISPNKTKIISELVILIYINLLHISQLFI